MKRHAIRCLLISSLVVLGFACADKRELFIKQSIYKKREALKQGVDSYFIEKEKTENGITTIYYSAAITVGSQKNTIKDSLSFSGTGDGIFTLK